MLEEDMPYIAIHYINTTAAPLGKWVCSPEYSKCFSQTPSGDKKFYEPSKDVNEVGGLCGGYVYFGQCVSYVRTVCPGLSEACYWVQGVQVKDCKDKIQPGTAIATFPSGSYCGHAAIFHAKNGDNGIDVYDQWIYGWDIGYEVEPIHKRTLWNCGDLVNNLNNFYIVESQYTKVSKQPIYCF